MVYYSGFGWMVVFGLIVVMATETGLRALLANPELFIPGSPMLLCGYTAAATYCFMLHWLLRRREQKRGADGSVHTFMTLPIWCSGIGYMLLGALRLMGTK